MAINNPGSNVSFEQKQLISSSSESRVLNIGSNVTTIAPTNPNRTELIICNSGNEDCFLDKGNGSGLTNYGAGIFLKANGGSYVIDSTNLYRGQVSARSASGAQTRLSISESIGDFE